MNIKRKFKNLLEHPWSYTQQEQGTAISQVSGYWINNKRMMMMIQTQHNKKQPWNLTIIELHNVDLTDEKIKITNGKVRILAEQKEEEPEVLGHRCSSSSSSSSCFILSLRFFFQAIEYKNRERLPCSEQF